MTKPQFARLLLSLWHEYRDSLYTHTPESYEGFIEWLSARHWEEEESHDTH